MMGAVQQHKAAITTAQSPAIDALQTGVNTSASATLLPSTALLRGQKSVSIEHAGVIYRLQVTKLGKLILTK